MVANKVELPLRGGGGQQWWYLCPVKEKHTVWVFVSSRLGSKQWGGPNPCDWQWPNGSAAGRSFFVGGSNPGQVHMPAAPMAIAWQGFEPPTAKTAAGCATIRQSVVAVEMCIPIAWSLLTTHYYTVPWGMLRD